MASRLKLPHLSFFAFTTTPKPKTLELFAISLAIQKSGYRAFHEYTNVPRSIRDKDKQHGHWRKESKSP